MKVDKTGIMLSLDRADVQKGEPVIANTSRRVKRSDDNQGSNGS